MPIVVTLPKNQRNREENETHLYVNKSAFVVKKFSRGSLIVG